MLSLIFKHIGKNGIQSYSIVILIASGTLLLFSLCLFSIGVFQGMALSEERGGADVMLVPKDAASEVSDSALLFTGVPFHMYMDADIVEQTEGLFGVERASGQFFAQTLSMPCCTPDTVTRIVGIDFDTDWTVQPLVDIDLKQGLDDGEVLLGSRVGGNPDGTVSILNVKYTVADRLVPTGSDLDMCIIADIDTVRDFAKSYSENEHYWEEFGEPDAIVSAVLVDLEDDLDENERARAIAHLKNIGEAKVIEQSAAVAQSRDSLKVLFCILLFATVMLLIMALLQLFSRFFSMAWERRSEFAVYRMVGASKRHLALLVGGEALLLSGVGAVIGLVAGYVLYRFGGGWVLADSSFPYVEPTAIMIAVVSAAVVVLWLLLTLLSVLAPLRQVGKVSPALVMRQSDIV